LKILQDHLSMSLKRVGRKPDGGVELQDWWWLPPTFDYVASSFSTTHLTSDLTGRQRLHVFAQCKAAKKKFSPNYVREMEGVLHRYLAHRLYPKEMKETQSIHLSLYFSSESPFTTATL